MAELLDERTLLEGVAILAALNEAKLQGDIRQTAAYVDDQRDPTFATYRVTLRRNERRYGALVGTAAEIVGALGLVVAR
jgi:hypothetical protein